MPEKFQSTLINADLGFADKALTAGQMTRIGEYKVPAGEELSLGAGIYDDLERATGRLYLKVQTSAPAEIKGLMRISVYSPQDRPIEILYEGRTELTGASTTRNLQIPMKEHAVNIREDQKLVIEFKADSTATMANAQTSLLMDVTKYVV